MYSRAVDRAHPTALIFLIDHSKSMEEAVAGSSKSKSETVADSVNRLLADTVVSSHRSGAVRDYFFIAVLGYGAGVYSALPQIDGEDGPAASDSRRPVLAPLSVLADSPLRVEERSRRESDGVGGIVEATVRFPVWVEPVAAGGTPMCGALASARALLADFVGDHEDSFPPIVLNLTDGESTDGDPGRLADELTSLQTQDGNVLLFNLHVSGSSAHSIMFPSGDDELPDQYAQLLFGMSSALPSQMVDYAQSKQYRVSPGARGFAYNADAPAIVDFLQTGTQVER